MKDRIFIVDDNDDIRLLLKRILPVSRFDIDEARNGEEALDRIDGFKPDLVLLDIVMPGIDGLEVLRRLRDGSSDVPVIFLSGKSESEDKVRGLESGGNDYITKPFNKAEVLARIDNQLKIRRLTCELKQANEILTQKQRTLDDDLEAAAGIQKSLLPQNMPDINNLVFDWRFMPSYMIGGDIFNIVRLDENHIGLYMIDVSGHGVPAALVTVSLSQILRPEGGGLTKERIYESPGYRITSPRAVMESLDREYPIERFGRYFTIVYMIIDTSTGNVTYSNAAHPAPVILRKSGELEILHKGGTIIGLGGIVPFEEGSASLHRGDRVMLFTDGILECRNDKNELYGSERFYSAVRSAKHKQLDEFLDHIILSITIFSSGQPFEDDISIVVMEYGNEGTDRRSRAHSRYRRKDICT